MRVDDDADWPVHDLREALELGLRRGGHLLTHGEHFVVRRILDLPTHAARVQARLVARKPLAFPVDELVVPGVDAEDLPGALACLISKDLVDRLVPDSLRAELSPARRLVDACRRLGLPTSGSWRTLADRVAAHPGFDPSPWVRPLHRGLVRRLQRFATLRAWPRPEAAVLERMEVHRWPTYPLSRGPALHPRRRALRAWERLHGALSAEQLTVDEALTALRQGTGDAPARLSLRRALGKALASHARRLERADPAQAEALYAALRPVLPPGRLAFRHARTLEALERPEQALQLLEEARRVAPAADRPQLHRAARRVARSLRRSVAPDPPLRPARRRELQLLRAHADHRPYWRGVPDGEPLPIETALLEHLAHHGRQAAHVEGRLWRTLCALLFADCSFLPVPGQLPVERLAGPLDWGTPGYRTRRADAVDEVLTAVRRGEGAERLADALERYGDLRLAGRHDLPPELLLSVVRSLAADTLAHIVEHLLDHRSRGLPDLVVLPGPVVHLDGYPRRLRDELLLVEVKGPGDTLSDAQLRWHDRLVAWGLSVEVWDVSEAR
jgi:hypothetical protein